LQVTTVVRPAPTSQQANSSAKLYIDGLIQALDNHPKFDIANITPGQVSLPKKGIWRPYSIFQSDTGERRSADQILDRKNSNLKILLNTEVTKIVFHTEIGVPTARCVKYKTRNRLRTEEVCVKEMGRIYLAAGAFHTPELLMKSEIKKGGNVYDNDQVRIVSKTPFSALIKIS
jgi:choline dehydrogenase-like flavoprotein